MNQKGQIITLDFLISLIAITLAIGILLQFAEVKAYNEKEELQWVELTEIAETASNLLVSSPEISCEEDGIYLVNCIDTSNDFSLPETGEKLAIPSGYGFAIEGEGIGPSANIPDGVDFYSVKRLVSLNGGNAEEITIRVWRG